MLNGWFAIPKRDPARAVPSPSPLPDLWRSCHRTVDGSGLGTTWAQKPTRVGITAAGFEPDDGELCKVAVGNALGGDLL